MLSPPTYEMWIFLNVTLRILWEAIKPSEIIGIIRKGEYFFVKPIFLPKQGMDMR